MKRPVLFSNRKVGFLVSLAIYAGLQSSIASSSVIQLNPNNDAYVLKSQPNTPHGGQLIVKGDHLNNLARKAWISFDITDLRFDEVGTTLDSASLTLTNAPHSTYAYQTLTFNVYGLTDESIDSWDEASLT